MSLKRLDLLNSYLIIASGVLQFIATPIFFRTMEEPAFWFINGGITLVLLGLINALRTNYAIKNEAIRRLSIFANFTVLAFWLSMVYFLFYKFARYPFTFIELIILAISLIFSLRKPEQAS